MDGFTEWLQQLSDDELREFVTQVLPDMNTAARSEQAARRRSRPTQHGTGCTCCGAGVRQWR